MLILIINNVKGGGKSMKMVVSINPFKGCLSSKECNHVVTQGIKTVIPDAEINSLQVKFQSGVELNFISTNAYAYRGSNETRTYNQEYKTIRRTTHSFN